MDMSRRIAVRQELETLLYDYWHDIDTNWGRNAGGYYTEDAVFQGETASYEGRAKIEQFYAWRVAQGARVAVHAVNNFRVDLTGEREAKATWYCLLYAHNGERPQATHPPITISLVTDAYVQAEDGRWLCRHRKWETLFQGGAPAHNPKL
ncbi:MAG: nuclear transport factor 2 family protein [Caulobacteraceae bacterium]